MAINKNALTRYRVLDKCFSDPDNKYFLTDLIKACDTALKEIDPKGPGIKKRTVQYDIRYMESAEGWNAQIDRLTDGRKTYYRYTDENFSIGKQPLHKMEIEELQSAMEILQRFQGMPDFEWVDELTAKLEQTFMINKSNSKL